VNPTEPPSELVWSRLILWRPRPEFPLPAEWTARACIALGELRPLLQAVSPVRDLSDIWRWVAEPIPLETIDRALASVARVESQRPDSDPGHTERRLRLHLPGQTLQAVLVLAPRDPPDNCERIELAEAESTWLRLPTPEALQAMLTVAEAMRLAGGCVAVGL
jgi:hypothetical protein